MAHVYCMLDNYGYRPALRVLISNVFVHGNNGYANAPKSKVISTSPVFALEFIVIYC
jgi:hypothetical protein